jgi:AraC family transcriptional regulator of adaptative response / DNA-3-methyladenine glycosylase II
VALQGKTLTKGYVRPGLSRLFPTAVRLARAEAIGLGMPAARLATLKALAEAAVADKNLFCQMSSIEAAIERLKAIRGIGEWTAQYIALRALREMDAFPATDIGLLRGAAVLDGTASFTPAVLLDRAESWRPWRAYAAQHLWAADSPMLQERG